GGTTTTVVDGDGLTSGTVVLSGVTNDVTGLSNTTLDAPDFATAGRAATEEQLSLVRDEIGEEIDANRTHYYSVNDNGVVGGNYDNDGATGKNALAAGVGATASGVSATAMGHNASAAGPNSVAIGSGAAVVPGPGTGIGVVVIGNQAKVDGPNYGMAIGHNAY